MGDRYKCVQCKGSFGVSSCTFTTGTNTVPTERNCFKGQKPIWVKKDGA